MLDFKNKNLAHYGCSFTYGQDSGGDDIDDPNLSHPSHLAKIFSTTYKSNSHKGDSNDTAFLYLYNDIINNKLTSDDIVFFNITSIYRTVYISDEFMINEKISAGGHDWQFHNVLPNYDFNLNKHICKMYGDFRSSYYYQSEIIHHLNLLKNINTVKNICNDNNIDVVFVDLFGDLNNYKHYNFVQYKNTEILSIGNRSFVHYVRKHHSDTISKSHHFYSQGYEQIARYISDIILKN